MDCIAVMVRLLGTNVHWIAQTVALTLLVWLSVAMAQAQDAEKPAPQRIVRVERPADPNGQSISGRLFLFTTTDEQAEPRLGPNWFSPEPFASCEVQDFAPGESRTIDSTALAYPTPLDRWPAGTYRVQALLDHKFDDASPGIAPGNLYSDVTSWTLNDSTDEITLTLDHVNPPLPFPQTDFARLLRVPSPMLTEFHRRPVEHRVAVILPKSYYDAPRERRYPVIVNITGFGGRAGSWSRFYPADGLMAREGQAEFIHVLVDGQTAWGHHTLADSATNGPRGTAFVNEVLPALDKEYRTFGGAEGRFLTGHSSGGWSSLWLQVNYPDSFHGVWSTSPDVVDFRDYQQVNLYADPPLSLYRDEAGNRRPLARRGKEPIIWYDNFGRMDDVLAQGGQLRSFEAVFSPLDESGLPQRMWDRETGRVKPEVVEAWKKYDISLILKNRWPELSPKLAGKLHVITGSLDTFYLEGGVIKLKERLEELGSDAEIRIIPDADHNLLNRELFAEILRAMSERFWSTFPDERPE